MRGEARRRRGLAYRPGTRANQNSAVLLYIAFALYFALQDFPALGDALLVFAEFLAGSLRAPKSITNVLSAVRSCHLELGFDASAFDAHGLVLFKRALPLTVRHFPNAAPPLSFQLLERLCRRAGQLGEAGEVFTAFLATLFFAMARASSLLPQGTGGFDGSRHPTWRDLVRKTDSFLLYLKWGKTRQAPGEGFWVPLLPVVGSAACPVAALERLRELVGQGSGARPLFTLPAQRGGVTRAPLTLGAARGWSRLCLEALGLEGSAFSLHSFRRGACTKAFLAGAQTEDLKELGGWRSDAV